MQTFKRPLGALRVNARAAAARSQRGNKDHGQALALLSSPVIEMEAEFGRS